jgi:3-deoxy-D-manno-octulosonic-acid transferase
MFFYSLAWIAVLVASAPWWLWKMATTGKYRKGLAERLGRVPTRLFSAGDRRPVIWIHAVSVGEVIAISRLVQDLRIQSPNHRVVVSTTTRTGQQIARGRFGASDVFYYPLDFASAIRPYLHQLQPQLFVLAETEFWPRMLHECRRAAIPVAVVNARISNRSYPRYLRLKVLWKRILAALSIALAQTEEDASRLRAIGVPSGQVKLGGNLKYDVRAGSSAEIVNSIRTALPANAKLLVCGSTLDGEEQLLLDAWPNLIAAQPELRMVLAPRHPERFAAVAALLDQRGMRWFRRSAWKVSETVNFEAGTILLLDSIGELAFVYSLATIAFVGGSLIPAGGHNPLEPAQFGIPIVVGPHFENFREIVEVLRQHEAIRVTEPAELASTLTNMLRDTQSSKAMGQHAKQVFDAEAGATARAIEALLALLPEKPA